MLSLIDFIEENKYLHIPAYNFRRRLKLYKMLDWIQGHTDPNTSSSGPEDSIETLTTQSEIIKRTKIKEQNPSKKDKGRNQNLDL